VLAASLMNLLDANVRNVAAPTIRTDLGGSFADLQWLTAGYTLAMAMGLLTGGRTGDSARPHRFRHGAARLRPDQGHIPGARSREGPRRVRPGDRQRDETRPIVAGLLIRIDGWRLVFLINEPRS
jgi:MFS family permease